MTSQAQALSSFAAQIGTISAFFGGVAATMLALLIFNERKGRLIDAAISAFVVPTIAFIVCALAATIIGVGAMPGADQSMATRPYRVTALLIMNVSFLTGIVSLITGTVILGWLRSRLIGVATSGIGIAGLLAVLWLSIRVS